MKEGCILSEGNVCKKFDVDCWGSSGEKEVCPEWAEAFELEYFYTEKLNLIKKLEIEKYESKTYIAEGL
ncbi:MAG: hypothetical protein AB9861_12400 [Methanosarcina sp.]